LSAFVFPVKPVVTFEESDVALNFTVAVPGPTTEARIVAESVAEPAKKEAVAVTAVADSFTIAVFEVAPVPESVKAKLLTAAVDGVELKNPSPIATTTPSARRLKLVFVDILFLSKVVLETFSNTADRDIYLCLVMQCTCYCTTIPCRVSGRGKET
jgi:hypothetical protein